MNYLIGRAPDMESRLPWAEHRNRQDDPKPITRREDGMQVIVNGIGPSVLDGHLWAFLNLSLNNQGGLFQNCLRRIWGFTPQQDPHHAVAHWNELAQYC